MDGKPVEIVSAGPASEPASVLLLTDRLGQTADYRPADLRKALRSFVEVCERRPHRNQVRADDVRSDRDADREISGVAGRSGPRDRQAGGIRARRAVRRRAVGRLHDSGTGAHGPPHHFSGICVLPARPRAGRGSTQRASCAARPAQASGRLKRARPTAAIIRTRPASGSWTIRAG